MLRKNKRIISLILVGTLIYTSTFAGSVEAQSMSSEKEEVVYVNMDNKGKVTGTYVVNIFTDNDITDYGEYSKVSNMNTKDEISYKDGTINIENTADKLYYQGTLDSAEIPWNVNIKYKMDGKEYSAEEIAGMSGNLTLEVNISENTKAKEVFFENYALQAAVKLDTNICKNIVSDEATMANVGDLKQLTYTVMPGSDKNIVITADVTDFEIASIDINGIKLNLGIDKNTIDTSELTEEINKLVDAVSELDDGATALNGGAESLSGGAIKLNEGINTINEALNTLNGKSSSLKAGSEEVKTALVTIQTSLKNVNVSAEELKKLSTASMQIKEGINNLVNGLKTADGSIDTYYSKLAEAGLTDINKFVGQHNEALAALGITNTQRALYAAYQSAGDSGVIQKLGELVASGDSEATTLYTEYSKGNSNAITNYIATAGKLISVEGLLKADVAYIQGSNQLIGGISGTLDSNKGPLMTGALALQKNYEAFDSSIQGLVSSLQTLASNMNTLKSGIDTLVTNYDALDGGIGEYTNAVNSITMGYAKICEGAVSMVTGTSDLYDGTKTLVDGTGEFVNETSGLDGEVDNKIDSMLNEFTGSDFEAESFVSDKNTNVNSVQFVIKVAAIEKPEVEENIEVEQEQLNFWRKFIKLFQGN